MFKRIAALVAVLTCSMILGGCAVRMKQTVTLGRYLPDKDKIIGVILKDGEEVRIPASSRIAIRQDTMLVIVYNQPRNKFVLDDILRLNVKRKDSAQSTLVTVGIIVGTILLIVGPTKLELLGLGPPWGP